MVNRQTNLVTAILVLKNLMEVCKMVFPAQYARRNLIELS